MERKKYVYFFGGGKAEGDKDMKNLLGGKGANLHEMTNLGIPVPPGFTITTEACVFYFKNGAFPPGLQEEVRENLSRLEKLTGKTFGSIDNPLLVSVRSGARASMPGMMDTILNLGLNDQSVQGLAKRTSDERFAYDSYRRFIQMFSDVVLGVDRSLFEERLKEKKANLGIKEDYELTARELRELVEEYKSIVMKVTGRSFPQNPEEQLWLAIEAVFKSWNNRRAIEYRRLHKIPDDWGTACNVQAMVFGNMGFDCATGVAFTRDPSTGEKTVYGEYLPNAQGEDVVAGIRTPKKLQELQKEMPKAYQELIEIFEKLERHYRDMMDIEFTIEKEKVYILQTRVGKRSARAEVKIAVDMVKEGLITKEEAILRVDPRRVEQLLHPMVDPKTDKIILTKGLPASPGAAWGKVIFDADEAADLSEAGEAVILVRDETSPDDIRGMARSKGILTARGGMTSHAAVVARGIGKPCVVGAEEIEVDYKENLFRVRDVIVRKGDIITIDGSTGEVLLGKVPTIDPEFFSEFNELLKWADELKKLGVRANADTPADAQRARKFGAQGIGLCRTEHMFFEGERIYAMQEMILAKNKQERERALAKLLPMQREDFKGLFKAMDGFPVTIRLLDPPLHEFVPKTKEQMEELSKRTGVSVEEIILKSESLREANPMLGHRGCRLGIVYPEITEMQARAIFEAACECVKEGIKVLPEIMVPIVSVKEELDHQKAIIDKVAKEVMSEKGVNIEYSVGTMIELPRACVTADKIAQTAEFFSFGTNDLTQTTFGFSRDDVGKFVPKYIELGILKEDPFQVLDQEGVGFLVKVGIEKGRSTRPNLKVGICGEHGGEPSSVEFCHMVGMDYVSCSPFRVPIARLAAAQAAVKGKVKPQESAH
ncbi:MAG: pyruvate, phosphate dikinase [candidate division WOR-3 bacterium]